MPDLSSHSKTCPLCGRPISPLESYAVVLTPEGDVRDAHNACTAGLPWVGEEDR